MDVVFGECDGSRLGVEPEIAIVVSVAFGFPFSLRYPKHIEMNYHYGTLDDTMYQTIQMMGQALATLSGSRGLRILGNHRADR